MEWVKSVISLWVFGVVSFGGVFLAFLDGNLGLVISQDAWASEGPQVIAPHRKLHPVPFTAVRLNDGFWAPRLETNHRASVPHVFEWCEKTGRITNFDKAAGKLEGKFEGIYFNDSDVYKLLEGAAYVFAATRDQELDRKLDEVIARIAAAQQPDGYLNTYFTLVAPANRWSNLRVMHQLYLAGHLIEAGVAHYRATGKTSLLTVATRFADHISEVFGPEKRYDVDGHEEIELALVKLYELTGKRVYFDLAKFFIDIRGDATHRQLYGPVLQDHLPVRQQKEIVGHAVRAMYLYCAMADLFAHTGESALLDTLRELWADLTLRKLYITGGVGARHEGEAFGAPYELPNASAYCETCAAVGLVLWGHRMNLLEADARYADVLERALYNGFLSGVSLDGRLFFYVNPLESSGHHHRQPFYPCACCPPNVVRLVAQVPGFVYAANQEGIFVNLFVESDAEFTWDNRKIKISQETKYPWEGRVELQVITEHTGAIPIHIRIPDWCQGAKISVNGRSEPMKLARGYAVVSRRWTASDRLVLELPMEVLRIEAHPAVAANRGRVAIQRGPLVYCFEAVDHGRPVRSIRLPRDPEFSAEFRPELLGGVTVITGKDAFGRPLTAIPYYAWDHREPGEMVVWVTQLGKSRMAEVDLAGWQGRLYRPLDPSTLAHDKAISLAELATPSASHCNPSDIVGALNDGLEPSDSCDHTIPRFTWWDRRGTQEWVQYDFDQPVRVSAVQVFWFDDRRLNRHCRVPEKWRLLYRSGEQWLEVPGPSEYGVKLDAFNRVRFSPIETTALRIEVQLDSTGPWSGGILEWKVE